MLSILMALEKFNSVIILSFHLKTGKELILCIKQLNQSSGDVHNTYLITANKLFKKQKQRILDTAEF